jgi:predicted small secreted protein
MLAQRSAFDVPRPNRRASHPGTTVAPDDAAQSAPTGDMTMTRIIWAVLVAAVLAGCNTMHGLGQDIERGGEKMQESADKNKR